MQEISSWQDVDANKFHNEIVPLNQPAVLRSLVGSWPAVNAGRTSAAVACRYLLDHSSSQAVYTIAASPEANGRFFYNDDLQSVNFNRGQIPLPQVLDKIIGNTDNPAPHAIAVQALPVRDVLPGFENENPMPFMEQDVQPTMWIGNRGRVSPHYDVHRNIACVMAGRREFTLFPPDQIGNMYLGPVLDAPGGVPISLVDLKSPDLKKFPRFATALDHAQRATLEPGDAIYIPSLWWHGVESLDSVNILVNYWWGGYAANEISANDTLLHGMLTIASLDADQRAAWRSFFDHFVFGGEVDAMAHLPDGLADISTSLTPEQLESVKAFLAGRLSE